VAFNSRGWLGWACLLAVACGASSSGPDRGRPIRVEMQDASSAEQKRRLMVERQIAARGVVDPRVLGAMRAVPRDRFVSASLASQAYDDTPLPIGHDQTISQPYIVAYMTEALGLPDDARVLEIGTGSGYQAAVLAEISDEAFTIEIVPALAERSTALLDELGYDNVRVRQGDGYRGWPDEAPFDGILATAAPDHVPPALVEQLAVGARLVIPVGQQAQAMTVVTKTSDGSTIETTIPVRFVPMTGEAREGRST
jgi:protein-L-isoaspartate(D-aspartate) O-methyltransferase